MNNQSEDSELIFFVHIPKTAGSLINSRLLKWNENGRSHCEAIVKNDVEFKKLCETSKWLSAHLPFEYVDVRIKQLTNRPVRYYTCIREPVSQLLSQLAWIRDFVTRDPVGYYYFTSNSKRQFYKQLADIGHQKGIQQQNSLRVFLEANSDFFANAQFNTASRIYEPPANISSLLDQYDYISDDPIELIYKITGVLDTSNERINESIGERFTDEMKSVVADYSKRYSGNDHAMYNFVKYKTESTVSNIRQYCIPTVISKPDEINNTPLSIELSQVSKRYAMFAKPEDRLKQMVVPRLQRLVRAKPSRYFREFAAVNDVSLTVRRGETVGIIGRNGSGKSTLLQMIVGTLTPTSGTVNVQGRIAALLELGAGFNPEFTGRENVYVNGAILGFSREEMDERFEAIAAFANIGEFIERPVKTYSSGMFVRLAFAVSTAVEPDILVVDEALSVGDEAFQRKCFARIEAIKERGGTILFVSHGAQTIVQLCDRAVLMDAGEKILEGEPKLVVGQYQRLVNASGDAAAQIRAEIKRLAGVTANAFEFQDIVPNGLPQVDKPDVEQSDAKAVGTGPIAADVSSGDFFEAIGAYDYWDDSLRSENAVPFENRGAEITDIRVETLDGKRVNVLKPMGRYKYCYRVTITEPLFQLGFGMLIKTTSGLEIGGAASSFENHLRVPVAAPNDMFDVAFEFQAAFNPSIYFFNAGVTSVSNSEFFYAHRILDAMAVRLVQVTPLIGTGYVNIDARPCFQRL